MNTSDNRDIIRTQLTALANTLDITLDETQLNVGGERSIMSPHKFVLTGTLNSTKKRVVLKCAKHPAGIAETQEEYLIQSTLAELPFAEQELIVPEEIFFGTEGDYIVLVTTFIEQEKVFTDHTLEEQFFMSLHTLECQESLHATTLEHEMSVRDKFRHRSPSFYLDSYRSMSSEIKSQWSEGDSILDEGLLFLTNNINLLQTFDRYLMHNDLVPHNLRIYNRQVYLLDFVSFRLGNKYESWARFINFMEIHSPQLVPLLLEYVKKDRGEEEYTTLRLMRVYKICFLLNFYTRSLSQTTGDLHKLTRARLTLWQHFLTSVLQDTPILDSVRNTYYEKRSLYRTDEEKERQRQFTWT